MIEIPVTTMAPREYLKVFGFSPYELSASEHLVDVGSGNTDLCPLSRTAPGIGIIQLDPAYGQLPADKLGGQTETAAFIRLPIALGVETKATLRAVSNIAEILKSNHTAARVTSANTMRYLRPKERVTALTQMLTLANGGLVQIYPVVRPGFAAIETAAAAVGIDATIHRNGIASIRQLAYAVIGLNNTLTIDMRERSNPLYARDRLPLAKQIAAHIIGTE